MSAEIEKPLVIHGKEVRPGSIAYLAKPLNRFFGEFPDATPLSTIARVDSESDARHATVELLGEVWRRVKITDQQRITIRGLFRSLYFSAPDINTFGRVREASKEGRIARLSGLSDIAQFFLQVGFEKHFQVYQADPRVRPNRPQIVGMAASSR